MIGDAAGPALGGLALDLAPRLGLPILISGAGVAILAVMLWSELRAGHKCRGPVPPHGEQQPRPQATLSLGRSSSR
jgi:hypothetical protein